MKSHKSPANSESRKQKEERLRRERARGYRDLWIFGLLTTLMLVPILWHILDDALTDIVVYARPGHICCLRWIEHLRAAGYRVHLNTKQDLPRLRETYEVPEKLAACHTAVTMMSGPRYVLEGHVPAADIERLRTERPRIRGLAVPGMPEGAPGLEGRAGHSYDVLAFAHHWERISLFDRRPPEILRAAPQD